METTLGENIARLRRKQEMSQEELALQLHVTRQAVSNWERNKSMPDIITFRNMSLLFKATMDEIVSGSAVIPALPPADRRPSRILFLLTLAVGVGEMIWQLSSRKGADVIIPVAIVLLLTALMHTTLGAMLKSGNYFLLSGFNGRPNDPLKLRRMVAAMEIFTTAEGLAFCLIALLLAFLSIPEFAFSVLMGLYIAGFVGGLLAVCYQYSRDSASNAFEAHAARTYSFLLACFLAALFFSAADLILTMSLFNISNSTPEAILLLFWLLFCCLLAVGWLLRELMLVRRSVEQKAAYHPSRFTWVAIILLAVSFAGMFLTGALL